MSDLAIQLAGALRLAERAHAQHELAEGKDQWPEFYAQWLIDNTHIWASNCSDGSCKVHDHE